MEAMSHNEIFAGNRIICVNSVHLLYKIEGHFRDLAAGLVPSIIKVFHYWQSCWKNSDAQTGSPCHSVSPTWKTSISCG